MVDARQARCYKQGMDMKEFEIDDKVFTVSISYFQGPTPGKLSGPPEDCYPAEGAEIEFEQRVEFVADGDIKVRAMDFEDFLEIYAKEFTDGDTDMAEERIENETISAIMEQAGEYEP